MSCDMHLQELYPLTGHGVVRDLCVATCSVEIDYAFDPRITSPTLNLIEQIIQGS